jgi:hypothetical protein
MVLWREGTPSSQTVRAWFFAPVPVFCLRHRWQTAIALDFWNKYSQKCKCHTKIILLTLVLPEGAASTIPGTAIHVLYHHSEY